ncbi:MAG: ParB/RepB/Spo0J family partition protein [Planctomycetes bacterium]|nr:ParB/RepB/Spo0J family partition protein [Planctomycetota bacterium]
MERRLGRGLGSLLGSPSAENVQAGEASQASTELATSAIKPNSQQPRLRFDEAALESLRDSIKLHGVIQPIAVRRAGDGFELISGERRLKAAKMAGLQTIPAAIHDDVSDQASLEWAMVENLQREDLDPIERAKGFQDMMQRLGLTQDQVAERVGLKRSTITNHLRLLDLPAEVQDALIQRLLSMGHARAIAGVAGDRAQLTLMEKVIREGWSVRQTERSAQVGGTVSAVASPKKEASRANPKQHGWVQDAEGRLRERLGTQSVIHHRGDGGGKITISYHDTEELDRVLNTIAPRGMI